MQKEFGLADYMAQEGRLIITAPSFDLDSFPALGERLVGLLSATVVEKQWDADIHSWLIDFYKTFKKLMDKLGHNVTKLFLFNGTYSVLRNRP